MRKSLIAGLVLALATASPAFAKEHHGDNWGGGGGGGGGGWGSFGTGTLQGTYIFEVSGFADDGKPGGAGILGTLTFDGAGGVTGDVTLTEADSGQNSCDDKISSGGKYTVTSGSIAPGTGTLVLPLTEGSINFNLVIPSPSGKSALALESDKTTPLGVEICGQPINTMVLKGHLKRVDCDN